MSRSLLAGLKYFFGVVFSMKSMSEQSRHEEEPHEDDLVEDSELLNEEDIPGASLNGKKPHELNVYQLKRWLSCHGAPVSGKKPELIERLPFINIYDLCIYAKLELSATSSMIGISSSLILIKVFIVVKN